jgi:hypothetical protein
MIAALVLGSLAGMLGGLRQSDAVIGERATLQRDARLALERIAAMVEASTRLMVPLEVTTATRDVLAVALPPGLDRNGDGYADADNNKNGVVDDDLPADETNDGGAGIIGIDDDGDGLVDNGASFTDNDENGTIGSAPSPQDRRRLDRPGGVLPGRHPSWWSACPTSRPSTATTTPCAPSPTT